MKDPKRAKKPKKPKPKKNIEDKNFDEIVGALLRVPRKKVDKKGRA